jgi:hypothetical protein
MAEGSWLANLDSNEIWENGDLLWNDHADERKCRLYAVACARRIWHLLPDDLSRRVVETFERLADGLCEEADLEAACRELGEGNMHEGLSEAQSMALSVVIGFQFDTGWRLSSMAEVYSHSAARGSATGSTSPADHEREWQINLALMKELLSDRFRPTDLPPRLPWPPTPSASSPAATSTTLASPSLLTPSKNRVAPTPSSPTYVPRPSCPRLLGARPRPRQILNRFSCTRVPER